MLGPGQEAAFHLSKLLDALPPGMVRSANWGCSAIVLSHARPANASLARPITTTVVTGLQSIFPSVVEGWISTRLSVAHAVQEHCF